MNKFDKPLMQTAYVWADMSYCIRRKVGAVISKDGRIISHGYNGAVFNTPNKCEDYAWICNKCGYKNILSENFSCQAVICNSCNNESNISEIKLDWITNDFTLHAEQNAILFAAKHGIALDGTSIHITTEPCKMCAKLIAQSGIKKVVYDSKYHESDGIDFLKTYTDIKVYRYKIKK